MNKTPITVLQELMIKYHCVPSYECVAQTGPQHLSVFEYRCVAHGVTARGVARSKKEAKQEAARRALALLAARGLPVPPPYHTPVPDPEPAPTPSESALPLPSTSEEGGEGASGSGGGAGGAMVVDARSYVTLLKELCEEYRLGEVKYELVGDTGPPHLRQFTVRAALAGHERVATATTKKAARQMASKQLYIYLRENLAEATKDFVENRRLEILKGISIHEKSAPVDTAKEISRKRKLADDESKEEQGKSTEDSVDKDIAEESNPKTDLRGEKLVPKESTGNKTTEQVAVESNLTDDTSLELQNKDISTDEKNVKDKKNRTDLRGEKSPEKLINTAGISRKRKSTEDISMEVQRKHAEISTDNEVVRDKNIRTDLPEEKLIPEECSGKDTSEMISRHTQSKCDVSENVQIECAEILVDKAIVKESNYATDILKENMMSENHTARESRTKISTGGVSKEVQKECTSVVQDGEIVTEREDALCRAMDKVMARYAGVREEQPWRRDLGQRIADYHLGLIAHIREEQRQAAEKVASEKHEDSMGELEATAAALGLTVEYTRLPGEGGGPGGSGVSVVSLGPTTPAVTLAGRDHTAAARAALRYVRRMLAQNLTPDTATAGCW